MTDSNKKNSQYTITKRIAKHGKQAVIVIPSILSEKINPGMLCKVTIDLIEENLRAGSSIGLDENINYEFNFGGEK